MVILMYMHDKFCGADARGLGDIDFQRKNPDFLAIFWQFLAVLCYLLIGAVPPLYGTASLGPGGEVF